MRITIFGAGAIGGLLGAELALAGTDVTLIARGPHLKAMKEKGLTLIRDGQTRVAKPRLAEKADEVGPQDYVIVTLKAHSVPGAVEQIMPLLGPETAIVMAVNGVPWWYFYGLEGPYRDRRLASVDPGDLQWNRFGPERIIGCVVYPAADVPEPGVVRHVEGDRFILGEPDGKRTERAEKLSKALIAAGFKAPARPKIRDDIWVKLWGNVALNPISALTGATLEEIVGDPGVRATARSVMVEAQKVAEALGIKFPIDVDRRLDGAGAVGAHKTSMLQDLEMGRPMEIDALVTAVAEMGRLVNVATPTLDTVLSLVRQRARKAGCYAA
jgi:2-dehydropantoate 2-reductase